MGRKEGENMDHTYKIIPYTYWQVDEYEQWLTELARDGWEAIKVGSIWIKFRRIQPGERSYKIIFSKATTSNQDIKEEEWKEIKVAANFNLYMETKASGLENLGYNQEKEIEALEKLRQAIKAQSIMLGLCIGVMVIILASYMIEENFIYKLITGDFISFIAVLFMQIIPLIQHLAEYIGLKKLQTKIGNEGSHFNRLVDKKPRKSNAIRKTYTFTILFIVVGLLIFLLIGDYERQTIPIEDIDIPIIRLASLEEDPTLTRYSSDSFVSSDVDGYNYYEREWNPLTQVQYEAWENGKINSSHVEHNRPFLRQEVYKLRFKGLGDLFVKGLMQRYNFKGYNPIWQVALGESDTIYMNENSNRNGIELIIQNRDYVVYVSYIGNASTDKVIEQVRGIIE